MSICVGFFFFKTLDIYKDYFKSRHKVMQGVAIIIHAYCD